MNCMIGRFKDDLCDEKMCEALKRIGESGDLVDIIMLAKELVRCKDCLKTIVRPDGEIYCKEFDREEMPKEFYCGFGERREP